MPTDEHLSARFDTPEPSPEAPKEAVEAPVVVVDIWDRLIPDLKSVRERLDKQKENEKYAEVSKELAEIEKLEGEAQAEAFYEFRPKYPELLLSDGERAQIQAQALSSMALLSGVDEDEDGVPDLVDREIKEEEGMPYWVEGSHDEDKDGVPDLVERPEEDQFAAFLEENKLEEPKDFVSDLKRLWSSAYKGDFTYGERFSVSVIKNGEGIEVHMEDTKYDPEVGATAEWEQYQTALQEELKTAELKGMAQKHEAAEGEKAQDVLVITLAKEDNEEFKERIETVMAEAEGVLSEEGLLPDGTWPNAATRIDGSMEPEEEMQDTLDKVREAMDGQKWIEAAMLFMKFLGLKFSSLFSGFGGGPSSGEEGEPQSLKDIDPSLSLSELQKYNSVAEIKANISDPGARVAAAAVLGVRKDTKAEHCSDWADKMAKSVGYKRYNNSQNAFVSPDFESHRIWYNRSKNKTTFAAASFQPGDMVIARSSGSPTGLHDQIVIDVDPNNKNRVLVASQESLNRRQLRWKTFTEDDVAVISRPGWTGPSSDADLLG